MISVDNRDSTRPDPPVHVRPKERGRPRRRPVEQVLAEILQTVFADRPGPLVIAIGGPGGTGKSTFADRLAQRLGDAAILRLDDYKTARAARRQAGLFGPHPAANQMDRIAAHLADLRLGQPFDKPVYDPALGDAGRTETYAPARFNLVEGEVATYPAFRALTDFAVFLDAHWRTQLATRLSRDIDRRAYSLDRAVATFLHSNLREFSAHGAASKHWADVHLFRHDDGRLELEAVSPALYQQTRHLLHEEVEVIELAGLIVPLLTPFGEDGKIARRALVEHLDGLAAAGVRRVLAGGTTGEFFAMTPAERLEVLKLTLEYFPGLVLFQAGGGPLPEALRLARQAQELGADGILCLPPSYYADAPTAGLVAYLRAVAAAVEIPLILYNFPRHTRNALTPAILAQVAHAGLKDSAGNLALLAATPCYFIGDDARLHRALRMGARGFVSAAANAAPALYVALEQAAQAQCWREVARLQVRIRRLLARLTQPEIAALKYGVRASIQDYPIAVRPPLAPLPLEPGAVLVELFRAAGRDPFEAGARRHGDP
ncbi:MAG: hypothetical protein EA420_18040 [Candidatus Competibacteraceae bacterium]|nr:MAG: hypothetical protein EA420_18040 [Candidatus Competibacteraceae bacterium]